MGPTAQEPEPEPLPILTFEPPEDATPEGSRGTIRLILDKRAPTGASVRYTIGNPSEGVSDHQPCRDYQYQQGVINLAGRTSATLSVRTLVDTCHESTETVTIHFHDAAKVRLDYSTISFEIRNRTATISIRIPNEAYTPNPEPGGDPILGPVPLDEGDSFRITLERTAETSQALGIESSIEVHLVPLDGATHGEDYEAGPYTVTFARNQRTATLRIRAHPDNIHGEAAERIYIQLRNPQGAVYGSTIRLYFAIQDTTETPRKITIAVRTSTPTVNEGETVKCQVTVNELEGRTLDQGLRVRISSLKGNTEAQPDIDYEAPDQWLTFGTAGSQTQEISIKTFITRENRGDRPFACVIGHSLTNTDDYDYLGDYTLEQGSRSATVLISNINVNDTDPGASDRGPVWTYDPTVTERSFYLRLNLNGELPDDPDGEGKAPLRVRWETSAGDDATATGSDDDTAGYDYTSTSGTYTFQPGGAAYFRPYIRVRCDNLDEDDEHFYVVATGERLDGTQVGGQSTVRITIQPEDNRCGGTRRIISIADASRHRRFLSAIHRVGSRRTR